MIGITYSLSRTESLSRTVSIEDAKTITLLECKGFFDQRNPSDSGAYQIDRL
jgi:hypothetical protein